MVQILNLILLTAPELTALRKGLKDCFHGGSSAEDRQVFVKLFECWSHNAVATFSLCLLAQAYQLSMCLIQRFAEIDVTVGFLMQADKLVQLLESPIFINLRLQLLEVDADYHVYLIKSLYGLLMRKYILFLAIYSLSILILCLCSAAAERGLLHPG